MINYNLIERNKSTILNIGIIILALVVALQFYKSASNQITSLIEQQNNELEKNKVAVEIATLEKKAEAYKKVFVKKDLASVMDIISGVAKGTSVKILSVKPNSEEALDNYLSSSFLITLNVPSYHALGEFISKIENHQEICLVNEVKINSRTANFVSSAAALNAVADGLDSTAGELDLAGGNVDLNVSLKINTIAYDK